MSEAADSTSVSTTRRNISLSESNDEMLDEMAAKHFNGNVSQLIRAAVLDYQEDSEDGDRHEISLLRKDLEKIRESVEGIEESIESLEGRVTRVEQQGESERLLEPDMTEISSDARKVQQIFIDLEGVLSVEDVLAEASIPPRKVCAALGHLLDTGHVQQRQSESGELRFALASIAGTPREESEL